MEKELRKFLEELRYNMQTNFDNGDENVVDIYYVIKRITGILENK